LFLGGLCAEWLDQWCDGKQADGLAGHEGKWRETDQHDVAALMLLDSSGEISGTYFAELVTTNILVVL